MITKRVVLPLLAAMATVAALGYAAYGGDQDASGQAHKTKSRKQLGPSRGLAALSARSVARMGQGEAMLYNVTETSPSFLKSHEKNKAPVRIAGVCRDGNGVFYNSVQKGYASCLDAQGAATSEYDHYGSAQRQAGVGILVGK